ncbi:uncharacterized protein LOC134276418 [Saccostrea cucullata]|uniref:uncharacterized protein LOC134276418 n=1 Tax=Saccostrea cuccullata TaxID=36930 RepID=UPI002ED0644C
MADELFCHYPPELKCRFTDHGQCSGDLVNLIQCVKSTGAHLRYLKTKGDVSEIDLILNRGGLYDVSDYSKQLILVCKEHRDSLGLYWRKKTKCDYPLHSGVGNVADRAVNKNCSSEIFYMFNCLVPIGSAICKKCRVVHTKMIALLNRSNVSCFGNNADTENGCNSGEVGYETDEKNDSQTALPVTSSDCYDLLSSQTTQASIPSSHEEWEPESSSLEIINEVISLLSNGSLDPLRSQLSVPLTESAPRTQRYYERRAKEIVLQLLEFIAPSQSQLLLEKITDKSDVLNTSSDDKLLQAFVKAYQEASHSPLLQKQILSVISSHFQKNTLLESFPNVTKYKIDVARDYSKKGGMAEPQKLPKSTKFSRLPQEQVQHFVDFISQPQYVQDVAFGERTLKLSTGQKIHIPDIVRTVIGSRIISSYTAYCEETSFHPCKRSTLYELLRNCSATQRKSLCGLDNTTADGICSLEKMISIAEAMESYGALSHVSQV